MNYSNKVFFGGNTPLECHPGWVTEVFSLLLGDALANTSSGRRPKSIATKQRKLPRTGNATGET